MAEGRRAMICCVFIQDRNTNISVKLQLDQFITLLVNYEKKTIEFFQ